MARKKRWNVLEEKRIKEEIELQSYLNELVLSDKEKQISKLREDITNNVLTDDDVIHNLEHVINSTFDERIVAVNDIFAQIDDKRKVRYQENSPRVGHSLGQLLIGFLSETRSAWLLMRKN